MGVHIKKRFCALFSFMLDDFLWSTYFPFLNNPLDNKKNNNDRPADDNAPIWRFNSLNGDGIWQETIINLCEGYDPPKKYVETQEKVFEMTHKI